ncbi:SDR family oxidoreductase [Microbaculum marinum]|uniref:SDR family oxidoreductase n=1 Tax=Microbaculum marinum TaxID=1764581 RepID=A0AAW9RU53_9HYPH
MSGTAIITGGAQGIGGATALRLARRGWHLLLVDLDETALAGQASACAEAGGSAETLVADVRDLSAAHDASERLIEVRGGIDALVNAAGISMPKTILEITEEEWDRVMDINLKGVFTWCKAVAAHMAKGPSKRIINISSVNAHTGGSPTAVSKFAYAASKSGVLGLTRGLAQELGPGCAVNCVCPGLIETRLTRELIGRVRSQMEEATPLRRVGKPDDIAVVIEFLATVEPNYMTGEIIDIDGGRWVN